MKPLKNALLRLKRSLQRNRRQLILDSCRTATAIKHVEESVAALLAVANARTYSFANGLIRPLAEDFMSSGQFQSDEAHNPIDRVERLAEVRHWSIDRTSNDEVVMNISGGWCDLDLSLSWRSDLESLTVACTYDMRVPQSRRDEVSKLLINMNSLMVHGHFDLWPDVGILIYRNALLLVGGAEVNDEQCEAMIKMAIDNAQRYYPAVQLVIWGGQTAEQAMSSALIETQGEA
jgi:hypothetical protein